MYYKIAQHLIHITTPHAEATAALLPNFEAFRAMPAEDEILFSLSGNMPVATPDTPATDCFSWNGIDYEVHAAEDGLTVSMQLGNRKQLLFASPDWRQLRTDLSLADKGESLFLNNFLIVAFGMTAARFRTLKVHASVIEKEGRALLLLGKSGTGKSTHSRLWQEYVSGCALLNDDEPVVRIDPSDGVVWVYGTPWSGKTPCYRNRRARVTAFVQLYQCPENRLSPLPGREAFASLFASSCMMRSDAHNKNHIFNTVADVLEKIPVYRLDCRPDREAVALTETLMM